MQEGEDYWREILYKERISPPPGELLPRIQDILQQEQGLNEDDVPVVIGTRFEQPIRNVIARLHQLRVFHGDLHLGNIVTNDDGEIFLIDFETTMTFDQLKEPENLSKMIDWLDPDAWGYPATFEGLLARENNMPFD